MPCHWIFSNYRSVLRLVDSFCLCIVNLLIRIYLSFGFNLLGGYYEIL